MPHDVLILPATRAHVGLIVPRLRAEDRVEVEALHGDALRAIRYLLRRSSPCRTAFVDGEIAAMWGRLGGIVSPRASVWLVTTPAVEKVPLRFAREARNALAELSEGWIELYAERAASYVRAGRFFKMLGFRDIGGYSVKQTPIGDCFEGIEMVWRSEEWLSKYGDTTQRNLPSKISPTSLAGQDSLTS